jgi:predicted RND superfamily exporter protein
MFNHQINNLMHLLNKLVSATRSLVRGHLQWIFVVTTTRPMMVFAACCLVFLLSCLSIARISFEADIFRLFPQKGPLSLFLDTMKWTGSAGNAYFLLEGDRETLVREADVFAEKLRNLSVDGEPAFSNIKYRVIDPGEAKSFADFLGYAVTRPQFFVNPEDVPRFRQLLSPAAADASLQRARTELATPGSVTDIIAADPLYLRDLILPRFKAASQMLDLDTTSPYFLSRDGRVLIIIAEPARPVTDIAFARKLVAAINGARKGSAVKISCTGAHLSAVADEAVFKENVLVAVLTSLAVVLAIFFAAYRRFLPTLLIPLILVFGIVPAIGVAGLIHPTLSVISLAFTSLIIGLGTDYPIHLYDRFHFERSRGRSPEEALRLATVDTGHALFTSATTTAFPFLCLVLSDVRALAELGLLVGLGGVFSLYATLFFLPPLLIFMEKRFPRKEYRPLPGFSLGAVWRSGRRHRWKTAVFSILAVLCLLLAATNISFESELKNLQPRSSEAFITQENMERHLSISPKQLIVAVEGKDLADILSRGGRVDALARQYRQRGELVSFSSLGQVINDAAVQRKVIEALARYPLDGGLDAALRNSLARQGFAVEPFRHYTRSLAGLYQARILPVSDGLSRLSNSPFRGIVERHLIHNAGGYHLLSYLNYRGPEFRQGAFLKELRDIDPTVRATSVDLVSGQLSDSVRRSFIWGLIAGGAIVLFLLVSHFNTRAGIFYTLFPLYAGIIAMLGLMALFGMRLNFMNVMVLVTIIGMGSDYGLHVAHRVRNCAPDEYQERYIQSGRAVLLSCLTNIVGFGSLVFTDYGALASIGWATNFGIAAITLFTLVTLPAFMRLPEAPCKVDGFVQ